MGVESGLQDYGYMTCFCADGEADDDAADNAPAYDGAATGNGKRTVLLVARFLLYSHAIPVGWVSVFVCVCVTLECGSMACIACSGLYHNLGDFCC